MLKLGSFKRALVNKLMTRPLTGPYEHMNGFCWSATLSDRTERASRRDDPRSSSLLLYEDGVPMKYPSSSHDHIAAYGRCRFSHTSRKVYFSTSDNSDPNTNGRTYRYSVSPWLYRRRLGRLNGEAVAPLNHLHRDATPQQIEQDVAYALSVGKSYLGRIRSLMSNLKGKSVLEVGPGINYGAVLTMACHGMRPMVADRFLSPWEAGYHERFYTAFAKALAACDPDADLSPVHALLQAGGYDEKVITCLPVSLETLPLPNDSVDVVFSNAVVEHLSDLHQSFTQLYRVTTPGGCGLHQVDFRDHRHFDRPLEYLLLEEKAFQTLAADCFLECGNRYRPDEATTFIEAAGFKVEAFDGNCFSTPEYLADFMPRLRAAKHSRYRTRPAEELHVVGGCYQLRKPGA